MEKRPITILITGANGQLGNEMRNISQSSADRYVFTDIAELDITNIETIRRLATTEDVAVIVNCAAYTNVDKAEEDKNFADFLNNKAVANLAIVSKEVNAHLIHISTDYVFGGNQYNTPITEDAITNPLGVYGETKLRGEEAIYAIGCKHLIFRTSWLYSAYGNNFVKTMRRLTHERDTLNVVFDQVGTPTYAADLASVIYSIIENRLFSDHQGIYHFSNEGVISWYDFAQAICELSGNKCSIHPCHSNEFPSKVTRPSYSVLDKTKVKNDFNITIPYWKDSLKRCIQQLESQK